MDGRFCWIFRITRHRVIRIRPPRAGCEICNSHHEKLQMSIPVQGNIREIIISCMKGPDADELTIQQGLRFDGAGIFSGRIRERCFNLIGDLVTELPDQQRFHVKDRAFLPGFPTLLYV